MNDELRWRLIAINRRFYRRSWQQFVDRRRRPWPGWQRLMDELGPTALPDGSTVLDLGCGHGRFKAFLDASGRRVDYLGIDTSLSLLLHAKEGRETARWVCGDRLTALPASARFDLVVAFGLLHHIPGMAQRRELARDLATRTAAGGKVAITLWSPDAKRRRRATPVEDGEPGDVMLPWGDGESRRYCHLFEDAEAEALGAVIGAATGSPTKHFRADGRGGENHYLIAHR